jgi:multiple sugar transport system permease protein
MKVNKVKMRHVTGKFLTNLFIIVFGLAMLYPIIWMLVSSFKPNNQIFSDPGLIPSEVTLEHYKTGWAGIGGVPFVKFFLNSFTISILAVIGNVITCTMAAYAFSRLEFFGRKFWFAIMMFSIMLPAHVTTIPRFTLFNQYGWINTFLPIVVPKFLATDAFFVFLMVQFIRGIPKELDEAATIEGGGRIKIFFRIIIPLSVPAMVTTALFTFLWTWDDFFNQLLYIYDVKKYSVSLGLRMFVDATGESNWGAVLSMSVLSVIPAFVLFFSLQKYFVQGIATTGLKG